MSSLALVLLLRFLYVEFKLNAGERNPAIIHGNSPQVDWILSEN